MLICITQLIALNLGDLKYNDTFNIQKYEFKLTIFMKMDGVSRAKIQPDQKTLCGQIINL